MKKWLITAAVVLALAGLALTSSRWLPPFLAFLGVKGEIIQTLSSLVELVLSVCSVLALVVGLWTKKTPGREQSSKVIARSGSMAIGGGVSGGNIATGGDNVSRDKLHITGDTVSVDQSVTHVYGAQAQTANALHQLPAPPRDFTGRADELDELTREIESGGATISGLQGQGGVGKTTLALKLAELLAPRFPDAQFYLDLKGTTQPLTPSDAMAHVIRAYHPTAKLPDKEDELRALYNSVLHGQRALLLMDNARNDEQVLPLIPPDTCVLLVTSRWHFALPGLFAKNLDTLPPEDARALLTRIAPRIGERADEIARLCGYLPLALRLAASALAERRALSPADYARRLSGEQQRLKLLDKVEASLSLSYDLLTPDLQKLWRALAVFPATFDAPAAAAVWETEQDATQDALDELVKYSLLDWDDATARYSLHDLARLLADNRLSEEERYAAQVRYAGHYLNVLSVAGALYLQGGEAFMRGLSLFDTEWANIQAGQSWAEHYADAREAAARLCSSYPNRGSHLLNLRLHPRERISWLESALSAARKLNNRVDEAASIGNLGIAYGVLGELLRAIEFHEQHLVIARELGNKIEEGYDLMNLGITYKNLREPQRAIEFYEQALIISREINDRRNECLTLYNLGNAYIVLEESQRASEYFKQALSLAREIGDLRSEGTILWGLSVALYLELGNLNVAITHAENALRILEQIEDPIAAKVRKQLSEWRGQAE
jgi:tetratricopeptide (TPR) repeat protein